MENSTVFQAQPQTEVEYEAEVQRYLVAMESLHEQMYQERAEIERLKVETQLLKNETRTLLLSMGAAL